MTEAVTGVAKVTLEVEAPPPLSEAVGSSKSPTLHRTSPQVSKGMCLAILYHT